MDSTPHSPRRDRTANRLAGLGTTIFAEMSALAVAHDAINLGQGFPDTDGPDEIIEAAVAALRSGQHNQYAPGPGIPALRTAIADHQQRWWGQSVDPDTEVLVTTGATEAIAARDAGPGQPRRRSRRAGPVLRLVHRHASPWPAASACPCTLPPPDFRFDPAARCTTRSRHAPASSSSTPRTTPPARC